MCWYESDIVGEGKEAGKQAWGRKGALKHVICSDELFGPGASP